MLYISPLDDTSLKFKRAAFVLDKDKSEYIHSYLKKIGVDAIPTKELSPQHFNQKMTWQHPSKISRIDSIL